MGEDVINKKVEENITKEKEVAAPAIDQDTLKQFSNALSS